VWLFKFGTGLFLCVWLFHVWILHSPSSHFYCVHKYFLCMCAFSMPLNASRLKWGS
jgi:hypothetical protein